MMMFNVEDLLALPQLKQGKLPKHFSEVNVKDAVGEVADIMDYMLKIKGIDLETKFKSFDNDTVLFDKQRFQ